MDKSIFSTRDVIGHIDLYRKETGGNSKDDDVYNAKVKRCDLILSFETYTPITTSLIAIESYK
jgi:hypothetical protein